MTQALSHSLGSQGLCRLDMWPSAAVGSVWLHTGQGSASSRGAVEQDGSQAWSASLSLLSPLDFGPDLLKSFGGQERRGLEGTALPSSRRGRMHTGFSQILWEWLLERLFQCHLEKVSCSQQCAVCPHAAAGPADRSLLCQVLARVSPATAFLFFWEFEELL